MRTRWYVAAAVVGTIAVTPFALRQFASDRLAPKKDAPRDSVRFEHEVVTVIVDGQAPVVPAGVGTTGGGKTGVNSTGVGDSKRSPRLDPSPSFRRVVPASDVSAMTRSDASLAKKAGRAFLGDGRHRPQPFPTAR